MLSVFGCFGYSGIRVLDMVNSEMAHINILPFSVCRFAFVQLLTAESVNIYWMCQRERRILLCALDSVLVLLSV